MPKLTDEIRTSFLDYFKAKDHAHLPSGSVVPSNDPTLMFANAGMVQFKNVFTGQSNPPAPRAATVQKCVRISGKHNDLENVGRTSRHHTFFEMLGNFSFGDYFKKEACAFGWEFLTDVLKLDKDKLWVSVLKGNDSIQTDEEAKSIWTDVIGVSEDRMLYGEAKDNFWSMGDVGPCGPCSEIMYDRGEAFGEASLENGERFFELWNLVFMQFFVETPGGPMVPLPKPSIDTGAGLERLASVLQGVDSNYDIDVFSPLVQLGASLSGKSYGENEADSISMRVIADHSRMAAHLIAEGIMPEKSGREYVLRRVMRRAIRHGHRLGITEPFFHKVANKVVEIMGGAYPELVDRKDLISRVCLQEEERFRATLGRGLELLSGNTDWHTDAAGKKVLPGEIAFDLSATYGFPMDLVQVIGEEDGFSVDEAGFIAAQEKHKAVSGAGKIGDAAVASVYGEIHRTHGNTQFVGYTQNAVETSILALVKEGALVETAAPGDEVEVVLSKTPCYGESGGQVGDTGTLIAQNATLEIVDTTRPLSDLFVHRAKVTQGTLESTDIVTAQIDTERRNDICRNHTATHILHSVLRETLGHHATQKGSRVDATGLRFDFTHFEPVTPAQLFEIERKVAKAIMDNTQVTTIETTFDEAKALGAMAIFEENYADTVRLVEVEAVSKELCGGIHVTQSGDIGAFVIISEVGIAAGVRRIEALTGSPAIEWLLAQRQVDQKAAALLKTGPAMLADKVEKLLAKERELNRTIDKLKRDLAEGGGKGDIMDKLSLVNGIKVIGAQIMVGDPGALRDTADKLRQKMESGVVCLGGDNNGKAAIVVAVTKDLTGQLNANKIIKEVAAVVGGKGGGRPDFAQAGGTEVGKLDEAVQTVYHVVEKLTS